MNIISEEVIKRGLVLTLKNLNNKDFFLSSPRRLSAPTHFHSSLHSPVKRSRIKDDNDQAERD